MPNTHLENELLSMQINMRNYAFMLTLNIDESEDLCQETTLRVLENCDKFVNNQNFSGWVFTIMKNIFINNYRKALRNQIIINLSDSPNYISMCYKHSQNNPESSYSVGEINFSINSLEDEFRIPFSMYIQGYKYDEIANCLHIPIGTVKSRIYLTRKQLHEQLNDYY